MPPELTDKPNMMMMMVQENGRRILAAMFVQRRNAVSF